MKKKQTENVLLHCEEKLNNCVPTKMTCAGTTREKQSQPKTFQHHPNRDALHLVCKHNCSIRWLRVANNKGHRHKAHQPLGPYVTLPEMQHSTLKGSPPERDGVFGGGMASHVGPSMPIHPLSFANDLVLGIVSTTAWLAGTGNGRQLKMCAEATGSKRELV